MDTAIKGVVRHGVIVPESPLPEGTTVEIHLVAGANSLLHFTGHLDPNDPIEQEVLQELARHRQEDLQQRLREDGEECPSSSSTPTT